MAVVGNMLSFLSLKDKSWLQCSSGILDSCTCKTVLNRGYRRLDNFNIKNNLCKNVLWCLNFHSFVYLQNFLMVDGYNNGQTPGAFLAFFVYYQVSLAVVINWTFTSGGVDLITHSFIDHHCMFFFQGWMFTVGLNHNIILTEKFSQSTVVRYSGLFFFFFFICFVHLPLL